MHEKKNSNNEKRNMRNMRMKKVRKKLSFGARVKRNPHVGTMGGEVKDCGEDEKGEATGEVKKQKRKSFRTIEGGVRGEYFVSVDTGDSVWELPKDGEIVF
jgi:hypothetical protein